MRIIPTEQEITTMLIIEKCIRTLYEISSSGGCCHIVTDDFNYEDDDLKFVIEYCQRDENADCPDRFLSKFICEQLLTLRMGLRDIVFAKLTYEFE